MSQKPAPFDPWPAVRVLAQVVGLREAARRFAAHGVTEAAARKRSQRERWAQDGTFGKAKAIVTTSPPAATAAQVLAAEMSGLSGKTRLGLARAQAAVAEHVEGRDGAENLADAQNIKAAAQTSNLVFGWDKQSPAPRIRLELLANKGEVAAIEVESVVDRNRVDGWE